MKRSFTSPGNLVRMQMFNHHMIFMNSIRRFCMGRHKCFRAIFVDTENIKGLFRELLTCNVLMCCLKTFLDIYNKYLKYDLCVAVAKVIQVITEETMEE